MLYEKAYESFVNSQLKLGQKATSILIYDDFVKDENLLSEYISSDQTVEKSQTTSRVFETDNEEDSLNIDDAATRIQRAWRRHIDVQVYKYYRDLISFKSQGHPALLLRCINPQEANLIDSAFGGHVKFRLAGISFPPNIYYKIFTHRPIQDLCANSPKDYTKSESKLKGARQKNNKTRTDQMIKLIDSQKESDGWYKRVENNGWRLVSDRVIANVLTDNITWQTSRKPIAFHYNLQQRREDLLLKKKKRKIEWMQKLYNQGMLKCRPIDGVKDTEAEKLVDGAARGMLKSIETYGMDSVQDEEVDELLEWTTALNFDQYHQEWKEIATSASSKQQTLNELLYLEEKKSGSSPPTTSQASNPLAQRSKSNPRSGFSHNTPVSRLGEDIILELEEEDTSENINQKKA